MSHPDFIFMLTRNDRTVAGAAEYLETALEAGVRHIGFKDIGQPVEELARLNQRIKAAGASSYLEVVSQDLDSELTSVRVALDLGVDYLLGGTHVDEVLPLLPARASATTRFRARSTAIPASWAARWRRSSPAPAASARCRACTGWTCWPIAPASTCRC